MVAFSSLHSQMLLGIDFLYGVTIEVLVATDCLFHLGTSQFFLDTLGTLIRICSDRFFLFVSLDYRFINYFFR